MSHARRESQEVLDTPDFEDARHGESQEALAPTIEHEDENGDHSPKGSKHSHAHDHDHDHSHGHDHHHTEHKDGVAALSPGKQVRYVAEVQQQRLLVTSASRSSLTIQNVFEPTPVPVTAVAAVSKSPSQIALARKVPREQRYYLDLLSRADDYSKLRLPVHRSEPSEADQKQEVTVDFTALPVEFALYIYSFLGPRDVVAAFSVNKKLTRLMRSEVQSWVVTQPSTIQAIPKQEVTRLFIKFVWNGKAASNAAPHTVSITSLHGHGHKPAPASQKMSMAAVVPGCDLNACCNDFFCCRDPACMTRCRVLTCRDKRATCLDVLCMSPCGLLCIDCEGAKTDMVVRGDFGEDFDKCCGGCGRSGLSYKDTGDITGLSECVYCGLFGTAWCARNILCWSAHCVTCQLPFQCQSWKTFNNNLRQCCTADLNCYH